MSVLSLTNSNSTKCPHQLHNVCSRDLPATELMFWDFPRRCVYGVARRWYSSQWNGCMRRFQHEIWWPNLHWRSEPGRSAWHRWLWATCYRRDSRAGQYARPGDYSKSTASHIHCCQAHVANHWPLCRQMRTPTVKTWPSEATHYVSKILSDQQQQFRSGLGIV